MNPDCELAAAYRAIGAGIPSPPPTRIGPAMLFENLQGYPGGRVVTGVLARRERTALLLDTTVDRLPLRLLEAVRKPVPAVTVSAAGAPWRPERTAGPKI